MRYVLCFDDTDKGLSPPQPLQAVGFDDNDKGLSQPQPVALLLKNPLSNAPGNWNSFSVEPNDTEIAPLPMLTTMPSPNVLCFTKLPT